jgi:hypothetical protein
MSVKIGINGFGRIGRMVFRAIEKDFPELEVVGINDLLDNEYLAYMLKYDSVHGRFNKDVKVEGDNFVIGIAKKTNDANRMIESAKQMAAVMMNRNKNSFVIKNYAMIEKENLTKSGSAKFELNVGSTKDLQKIYEKLELVDYSIAYGYFLGLFSIDGRDVSNKTKIENPLEKPSWFDEGIFSDGENTVICHTKATSYNLVTAWEKAAEKSRQKFL